MTARILAKLAYGIGWGISLVFGGPFFLRGVVRGWKQDRRERRPKS